MPDLMYADARLAALYDRLYPPTADSLGFYLPMIMAAQSVLDVGCGTGALLAAAREGGYAGRLCGLDPAEAMLTQARARADISWIRGEARSLGRRREFDLIIMSGHAFQTLIEDQELRATLVALRAALRGAGRFVFETRNPAARAWEEWTHEHAVRVTDAQGDTVTVSLAVETPFDGRTVGFTQTFDCASWEAPLVSRSVLRFLDAAGVARFLHETGFAVEAQYGDFGRRPLASDSREIITIARAL